MRIRRVAVALGAIASVALVACGGATVASLSDEPSNTNVLESAPAIVEVVSSPIAVPEVADLTRVEASPIEAITEIQVAPVAEDSAAVVVPTDSEVESVEAALDSLTSNDIVAAYEEVLGDIYESALPSVVYIRVERNVPASQGRFGGPSRGEGFAPAGEGSGFVWSGEGHIVTNHHVIAEADRVTVVFADGSEFEAEVLGSDADSDLAVLKIDTSELALQALELGDSAELRVGQLSLAIGNPFGQEFTMSRGIVSALGRAVPGANGYSNSQIIQTDTPINPGNSGGPLLDRLGDVIGINAQIISSSGVSAGVGFAIPINTAKRIVPELVADGEYQHAYLGISGASLNGKLAQANGLTPDTRGTLIVGIANGGPADDAGLVAAMGTTRLEGVEYPVGGDVIIRLDGTPIEGMNDLISYLSENNRPGDKLTVELLRDGEPTTVELTLQPRPDRGAA